MRARLSWLRDRRVLAAGVVLVLVAAALPTGVSPFSHLPGFWHTPDRWTEARAGWLYRSGQIPSSDVEDVLRAERIDVVIDLTDDTPDKLRDSEAAAAQRLGIRYMHLPVMHPKERLFDSLSTAVAEIELARRRGDRVLVHCTYGHRRSAAALALYARIVEHEPRHVAFAEFTRYSDADSTWSDGVMNFLDRNMDDVAAQVRAKLAEAEPG